MGDYPLEGEVMMVLVCVTLRFLFQKLRCDGHLYWNSLCKGKIAWRLFMVKVLL